MIVWTSSPNLLRLSGFYCNITHWDIVETEQVCVLNFNACHGPSFYFRYKREVMFKTEKHLSFPSFYCSQLKISFQSWFCVCFYHVIISWSNLNRFVIWCQAKTSTAQPWHYKSQIYWPERCSLINWEWTTYHRYPIHKDCILRKLTSILSPVFCFGLFVFIVLANDTISKLEKKPSIIDDRST